MNLYDKADDTAQVERLRVAGWFCVDLWGQKAWRSPDGRRTTMYTATAIQWLEEENAAPKPPSNGAGQSAGADSQSAGSDPAVPRSV